MDRDSELWYIRHAHIKLPFIFLLGQMSRCYPCIIFPVGHKRIWAAEHHTHSIKTANINLLTPSQANCYSSLETNQRPALSAAASSPFIMQHISRSSFPISGKNTLCHSHFVGVSPSPASLCSTFQPFCLHTLVCFIGFIIFLLAFSNKGFVNKVNRFFFFFFKKA